jgi:ferrochelatase
MGKGKWTRPYLSEEIERLANNGKRSLMVVPLSFVSENLETLYELDYEHSELAKKFGFKNYHRIATPGISPLFIEQMALLAKNAALTAGWEVSDGVL